MGELPATCGRVVLATEAGGRSDRVLVIDAQPHVMSRLRKLFDRPANYRLVGEYTHQPLALTATPAVCEDIRWVLDRYPMHLSTAAAQVLDEGLDVHRREQRALRGARGDTTHHYTEGQLPLGVTPRAHQLSFLNQVRAVRRQLLADVVGLGKTISALVHLAEPDARPALVVVQPHLCQQWEREIERVLPDATLHTIKGYRTYELPEVDLVLTSYNRLAPWQDTLLDGRTFRTVVADEVQELRHHDTAKRKTFAELSNRADYSIGLSGTPIYNLGQEIWSVLDALREGCLGSRYEFLHEWCDHDGKVRDPAVLHSFLHEQGWLLRRTPQEVGYQAGDVLRQVIPLEGDLHKLKEVEDVVKQLALSILSHRVGESAESSREFDWRLRQATGVAKARPAAEFVKMLVDSGEKVVVGLWHREVYGIIGEELRTHGITYVQYSGTETTNQKGAAFEAFTTDPQTQVLLLSLRSGAGVDGLQHVAANLVLAELDWSPHVMDQLVGRLNREGQTRPVQVFYLTLADGSDPFVLNLNGVKRSQHDGLIEGREGEADILADVGDRSERVHQMAQEYLTGLGVELPVYSEPTGLLAEVAAALRRLRLPVNSEAEQQRAVAGALPGLLPGCTVEREVRISARSRLDFLVTRGEERVGVECKITPRQRSEVYRQVRRYAAEIQLSGQVLLAPWNGIANFEVDGTPVTVVDTTLQQV